jgi:hypothetical protein
MKTGILQLFFITDLQVHAWIIIFDFSVNINSSVSSGNITTLNVSKYVNYIKHKQSKNISIFQLLS